MIKKIMLLSLALSFFFLVVGCGAQPLTAETPTINAIGNGLITTEPDTVEIRFSVVSETKDKSAQEQNAAKTQKVIDSLVALGLSKDELQTENVNFQPIRKWDNNKGDQIIGYRAENTIRVKTKLLEKAGAITDVVVQNGAEMVGSMNFYLSEEGKNSLLDRGIEQAVADAKKQAEATAKAAGVQIGGIKRIDIQKGASSQPIYPLRDNMMAKAESSLPTPVIPGETEYHVTVQVSFLIKQ